MSAQAWSFRLWDEALRLAEDLDGPDVVRALMEASDVVWSAGLDHAYHAMRADEPEAMTLESCSSFDVTWKAIFVAALYRAARGNADCAARAVPSSLEGDAEPVSEQNNAEG